MRVTFDFEDIQERVSFSTFYDELEAFCREVLPYGDAVILEADRLYDERTLVILIHAWKEVSDLLDECARNEYSHSFHDAVQREWEYYSQLIATLF